MLSRILLILGQASRHGQGRSSQGRPGLEFQANALNLNPRAVRTSSTHCHVGRPPTVVRPGPHWLAPTKPHPWSADPLVLKAQGMVRGPRPASRRIRNGRYLRRMAGRRFAVNHEKTPQRSVQAISSGAGRTYALVRDLHGFLHRYVESRKKRQRPLLSAASRRRPRAAFRPSPAAVYGLRFLGLRLSRNDKRRY